jgi:hypothetical protein
MERKMSRARVVAVVLCLTSGAAEAQQAQVPSPTGATNTARADRCSEFGNILKGVDGLAGTTGPEQVEKKYGRLADAMKAGEDCAASITDAFRNLRGQAGASPSWTQIERELDKIIDAQRSFIDKIEGTGGLIEEATRSESVLQQRVDEAQKKYPEEVDKEKDRLARLKSISAATVAQKDTLAQLIRDIQAEKPKIAFAEGGKQFDATINALDRFNKALQDFTSKMPKPAGATGM